MSGILLRECLVGVGRVTCGSAFLLDGGQAAPPGVPPTNEELIHTARFERLFPGEGGIDVHGILAALPKGIPYALEIPRATLVAQVGGKEHARLAIAAARAHLDGTVSRVRHTAEV